MAIRGILLDEEEAKIWSQIIASGDGDIVIEDMVPDVEMDALVNRIAERNPDILLVDYRLDENQELFDSINSYRAGALAQHIREQCKDGVVKQDFPIVLISTEKKIKRYFLPERSAKDLFDEWYFKEKIPNEIDRVRRELVGLVNGYESVRLFREGKQALARLLDLKEQENFVISDNALDLDLDTNSPIHELARYFLHKIVKPNGLLLSQNELLSRLALPPDDTDYSAVWNSLDQAGIRYSGIFSDGWRRWWSHRFEPWAFDVLGGSATGIPGDERVRLLNKRLGTDFQPAISRWSKRSHENFSFACTSCGFPSERRNSVTLHETDLPKFIKPRRICFDCVEADRYISLGLKISSQDKEIVDKLRRQEIDRG